MNTLVEYFVLLSYHSTVLDALTSWRRKSRERWTVTVAVVSHLLTTNLVQQAEDRQAEENQTWFDASTKQMENIFKGAGSTVLHCYPCLHYHILLYDNIDWLVGFGGHDAEQVEIEMEEEGPPGLEVCDQFIQGMILTVTPLRNCSMMKRITKRQWKSGIAGRLSMKVRRHKLNSSKTMNRKSSFRTLTKCVHDANIVC